MKAHLDKEGMQNDGNSGGGNTVQYNTPAQPTKGKRMALTNRRQRKKKIEPHSLPDERATPAEPTPITEPADGNQVYQPDANTVVTELEAAPGPGTGGRGRPSKKSPASFFDRLHDYSSQQWDGGEIVLSLYRLEPYTDRTTGGPKPVWVMKYASPADQERILLGHGSGRYRLYLNQAEPGRRKTVLVETYEFEILNPQYPPKIPAGEWVDDPRNKKWAWAHPNRQRQDGPLGVSDVLELVREAIRTERPELPSRGVETTDAAVKLAIEQSRGRDELAEKLANRTMTPGMDPVAALEKAVDLLKKLQPGDGKAAAVDPLAALDRAVELIDKLRPPQPAPVPAAPDLLSQADKFATLFEKLKPIFAPEAPEAVSQPSAHTRMAGWQEFLQPVLPEVLKSVAPLLQGLGQVMVLKATAQNGPAAVAPGAQPATAQPLQDRFTRLLMTLIDPALTFIQDGATGGDFGAFIYDGWGPGPLMAGRKAGVEALMAFYRVQAQWSMIANVETQFRQLLQETLAWRIPDEEPTGEPSGRPTEPFADDEQQPESPDGAKGEVIDLTAQS